MDENINTDKKNTTLSTGLAIGAMIVIALVGLTVLRKQGEKPVAVKTKPTAVVNNVQKADVTTIVTTKPSISITQTMNTYKNGKYNAIGTYQTPGGTEKIGVELTVKDGVIAEITVDELGIRPISKKMQADFGAHYKPLVIGKSIDTVSLSKVSGSSLSSGGFNNAIEQIKSEAKS